jgi:hypothetical protein
MLLFPKGKISSVKFFKIILKNWPESITNIFTFIFVCRQIWLNHLMNNHHFCYISELKRKKIPDGYPLEHAQQCFISDPAKNICHIQV